MTDHDHLTLASPMTGETKTVGYLRILRPGKPGQCQVDVFGVLLPLAKTRHALRSEAA
jgi:hypothetical protein